jgi:hypothetical protein
MTTQSVYKEKWSEVLKAGEPRYLRSIVNIAASEFQDKVRNARPEFVSQFVDSMHGGDIWIVESAISTEQVETIRKATLAFRANHPASSPKIVEGCPNYHEIFDGSAAPVGGYKAADHSNYFFRWNGDSHGLFGILDEVWGLAKIVSGRAPNEFSSNTPKDIFVDRIQVIQYPAGIGKITTHTDPAITMKCNTGIYLSTYGVDFQQGGFFVARGPRQPVLIDPQVKAGDMALWYPNLVHGVEPIDPDKSVNWDLTDGRWFLALNTVESHLAKERHVTRPAI